MKDFFFSSLLHPETEQCFVYIYIRCPFSFLWMHLDDDDGIKT